ncbi:hypothetical protein F5Y04DRAFT_281892 [Hypomontagnella monticulosa]|nr:hypothetical protein F5Y04DRAFT_281892 [Hypomontagnella monticulosa]
MSEAPSRTILDIMKGCKSFNDLPDDPGPFAERKIFLHQRSYDYIPPSKVDAEDAKYQEYLRSKWPCLEAMPEEFDPDKLEAVWQRQYASRIGDDSYSVNSNSSLQQDDYDSDAVELTFDQGYSPRHVYPLEGNSSSDSVNSGTSITKSLDSDEELEDYESEVVLKHASTGKVVQYGASNSPSHLHWFEAAAFPECTIQRRLAVPQGEPSNRRTKHDFKGLSEGA